MNGVDRVINWFLAILGFPKTLSEIDVQLPKIVGDSEVTHRYIFRKGQYDNSKGLVLPTAYEPSLKNKNTSIFRTNGLSIDNIWKIGVNFVERLRREESNDFASLKGGAATEAKNIQRVDSLFIKPETSRHLRHADIEGWPSSEGERKLFAERIARKATFTRLTKPEHKIFEEDKLKN